MCLNTESGEKKMFKLIKFLIKLALVLILLAVIGVGVILFLAYDGDKIPYEEKPEVDNIKKCLAFAYNHITAENCHPTANCYRKMVDRVRFERRHTHKSPIVRHFGHDKRECQGIAEAFFITAIFDFIFKKVDKQNYCHSHQNRHKMC